MLLKPKVKIVRGQQNTDEWLQKKVGKFSSSQIYKLFENPTTESKRKAVIKQLSNDLWQPCAKMFEYYPTTERMTYIGKYLVSAGFCKGNQITSAKKELRGMFKEGYLTFESLDDLGLDYVELLLIRGCYALDNIDILAGSAFGYAKEKHLEVVYNEMKEDLSKANIKAIEWGNKYEPLASKAFRFKTCNFVQKGADKVMIVEHLDLPFVSSPDDTIICDETDALIPSEYKCPINKAIHEDHTKIRSAADLFAFCKQKYYQIMAQIWANGAEYGYWTSYDPRLERINKYRHKASHTLKINLNKRVAIEFEKRIKLAASVRDQLTKEFFETSDEGLY